jgi:hypothetical protein
MEAVRSSKTSVRACWLLLISCLTLKMEAEQPSEPAGQLLPDDTVVRPLFMVVAVTASNAASIIMFWRQYSVRFQLWNRSIARRTLLIHFRKVVPVKFRWECSGEQSHFKLEEYAKLTPRHRILLEKLRWSESYWPSSDPDGSASQMDPIPAGWSQPTFSGPHGLSAVSGGSGNLPCKFHSGSEV